MNLMNLPGEFISFRQVLDDERRWRKRAVLWLRSPAGSAGRASAEGDEFVGDAPGGD